MPSTGTSKSLSPGPTDPGSTLGSSGPKVGKSESMKIRRTASAAKMLTKSKSSGSLKKKAEQSVSSKPGRDVKRSSSASGEDLVDPKPNGSLRRGEEEGEEEDEVWLEQGEEKKEPSIKGLWKKAFKNMKSPGSDSKWLKGASFKRRDSKHEAEPPEEEEPKEIDPVYSLLKCAADLPKIARSLTKEGQPVPCQGAHCLARASSPAPPGLTHLTPSGGGCVSCRGHHHSNEASSSHSLGHDFKEFYKQTSPIKRLSSSELGI